MSDATVPQTVLFPDLVDRALVVRFDQPHASTDGGAVLLKAVDRRLGLIDALAAQLAAPKDTTPIAAPRYPDGLTSREVEVLRLIAAGRNTREIAEILVISVATVERHISNLYPKIGARGRADATGATDAPGDAAACGTMSSSQRSPALRDAVTFSRARSAIDAGRARSPASCERAASPAPVAIDAASEGSCAGLPAGVVPTAPDGELDADSFSGSRAANVGDAVSGGSSMPSSVI